jgi:hypothetical protein
LTGGGAAIILDQELPATNSKVTIRGNRSQGDSTFAVVLGTIDSVIAQNIVDATEGTALFVGGNNTNLQIRGNRIRNAGTRAIRFNTAFFPGSANTGVLVARNIITNAGRSGISVDSVGGESALVASTIQGNTIKDCGLGIGGGDGIRIEAAAPGNTGNTISKNKISGSFNHDCHDATLGAGTAGTGNTWDHDTATTQSVANLCLPGPANGLAD